MKEKARVRVVTRALKSIRGHWTGLLIAFDKHLNLVRPPPPALSALAHDSVSKILQDAVEEFCEEENGPMMRKEYQQVFVKGDGIVVISKDT